MSEDSGTTQKEATKGGSSSEPKLEVSELLENSKVLTGYGRPLLAGALHGVEGKLTASQAKKKAAAFAEKPIVSDDADEEADE